MEFIKTENGVIVSHICANTEYKEGYIPVGTFYGRVGEPVKFYNSDWTRKDDFELYKEGLMEIPKGKKLEDDKLVEMTDIEKMQAGIQEIPRGMKIEDEELVSMTDEEKLEAGIITQNEIYEKEIMKLKGYLAKTDWIVSKCYELGLLVKDEYPEQYQKRVEARARINELEDLIQNG